VVYSLHTLCVSVCLCEWCWDEPWASWCSASALLLSHTQHSLFFSLENIAIKWQITLVSEKLSQHSYMIYLEFWGCSFHASEMDKMKLKSFSCYKHNLGKYKTHKKHQMKAILPHYKLFSSLFISVSNSVKITYIVSLLLLGQKNLKIS
jgi:hypothetical protein